MRLRQLLMLCSSEFIGTAVLICVGCGGFAGRGSIAFERSYTSMSICFGLALHTVVHTFGPISGGHVNPNVTLAAVLMGNLSWQMGCVYVLCQLLGGLVGYGVLYLALPSPIRYLSDGMCVTQLARNVDYWQGILVEFFLTAVLIYFYLAAWDKRNKSTLDSLSLQFGFLMSVLTFSAIFYTGSSFNMARSLPPALFLNVWKDFWVYPLGQVIAAVIVPFAWKYLHSTDDSGGDGEAAQN